mmetsp:Transcript_36118/g.116816  ORF Transcript_36118/g.116816 Transcript_36118/m.116816 type:complete len:267 (+) Transcript_36118:1-801(+)
MLGSPRRWLLAMVLQAVVGFFLLFPCLGGRLAAVRCHSATDVFAFIVAYVAAGADPAFLPSLRAAALSVAGPPRGMPQPGRLGRGQRGMGRGPVLQPSAQPRLVVGVLPQPAAPAGLGLRPPLVPRPVDEPSRGRLVRRGGLVRGRGLRGRSPPAGNPGGRLPPPRGQVPGPGQGLSAVVRLGPARGRPRFGLPVFSLRPGKGDLLRSPAGGQPRQVLRRTRARVAVFSKKPLFVLVPVSDSHFSPREPSGWSAPHPRKSDFVCRC